MNQKTHIATLRKSKGWTQEKLAEESQLSIRTIQRLESGNDASLETLRLVAQALDVSVEQLFEEVDDKNKEKEIIMFSKEQQTQVLNRKSEEQRSRLEALVFFILMLFVAFFMSNLPENIIGFAGILWVCILFIGLYVIKTRKVKRSISLDEKYPLTRGLQLEEDKKKNRDDFLWWKQPVVRNIMMVFWGAIIPLLFILKYVLHLF